MKDYSSNLSQTERLALASAPRFIPADSIGADERETVTLSTPRFPMPSMVNVREHDARLTLRGSPCNVAHDEVDEEGDEESDLREFARGKRMDGMRDHSLILPSQRGYAEAWSEARSYGYAND